MKISELNDFDPKKYDQLVKNLYSQYNDVRLPPEYASFVDNNLLRFLIRLARYKFVSKQLHPDDYVLDIGCGSGLGTIFLSQYCNYVKGIDIVNGLIEEAQSINLRSNIDFELIDFFKMSQGKQYDTIISLDVIEHMTVDDCNKFINKTLDHLQCNGMLVIGTPSIYSYKYQGALSKSAHIKCYDLKEITALISKYYGRILSFSMNDEIVHTGHHKMAWYYFLIAFYPKQNI